MATVPAPITWTPNLFTTDTIMNTEVRDAIRFLIGTSGVGKPRAHLRQTVAQSIPNAGFTALTFDVEDVDSDNMHSTVTNTQRLTAVTAGWYQVGGGISFTANVTGQRGARLAVNGTALVASGSQFQTAGAGAMNIPLRAILVFLNVGDFLTLDALQNSGAALNSSVTGVDESSFSAFWVSP